MKPLALSGAGGIRHNNLTLNLDKAANRPLHYSKRRWDFRRPPWLSRMAGVRRTKPARAGQPWWEKAKRRYLAAPIRNTLVPQEGHVPEVAGLPFFMVMACGSLISLLDLHFTQ